MVGQEARISQHGLRVGILGRESRRLLGQGKRLAGLAHLQQQRNVHIKDDRALRHVAPRLL